MYSHPEHAQILKRLFSGQEITFMNLSSSQFETKTASQTANETDELKIIGRAMKARKKKTF